MSTPDALLKRASVLLKKMDQLQPSEHPIEFETCWGNEIPPEWAGHPIYVTEWGGGAFDEDDEI